jgi:hypothetical protein
MVLTARLLMRRKEAELPTVSYEQGVTFQYIGSPCRNRELVGSSIVSDMIRIQHTFEVENWPGWNKLIIYIMISGFWKWEPPLLREGHIGRKFTRDLHVNEQQKALDCPTWHDHIPWISLQSRRPDWSEISFGVTEWHDVTVNSSQTTDCRYSWYSS